MAVYFRPTIPRGPSGFKALVEAKPELLMEKVVFCSQDISFSHLSAIFAALLYNESTRPPSRILPYSGLPVWPGLDLGEHTG
jgi:hypothetical protein